MVFYAASALSHTPVYYTDLSRESKEKFENCLFRENLLYCFQKMNEEAM